MHVIDGIAYADEPYEGLQVERVKVTGRLSALVTFSNGETRLFDAGKLVEEPAFTPLAKGRAFDSVSITDGYLSWDDGRIDLAAQAVYDMSFSYTPADALAM